MLHHMEQVDSQGVRAGVLICATSLLLLVAAAISPGQLHAQQVFNPQNGHTYEMVRLRGWIDWHSAKQGAENQGGYLATVTDTIEAGIVAQLLSQSSITAFLGGTDENEEGHWTWVTGEPWSFTNWVYGQPFALPGAYYLAAADSLGGAWIATGAMQTGYIVERDSPTDSLINLKIWPEDQGGNNHYYGIIPYYLSWDHARVLAEGMSVGDQQGYLASVTDEAENYFILNEVIAPSLPDTVIFLTSEFWLGGQYGDGGWHWISGEPFAYTNWAVEPMPPVGLDQVIAMVGPGFEVIGPMPGQWVDRLPNCIIPGAYCKWAVVEFGAEVPPCEPSVRHVPQDYPTIQAAINAACQGDEVIVAPGVYHESINFRGKNIVVHSAEGPLHTTITNERKVDLVRFNHGESEDAVLEGFTLRGGWMAVVVDGAGPTIRRNICVDQNVWNWSAIGLACNIRAVFDPTGDPRYTADMGPAPAIIENNTIVFSANGGISSFSTVPPVIKNNIVAFNHKYGIHQQKPEGQPKPILGYNDVFGQPYAYYNLPDPGPGSFSADPMLNDDLTLREGSPCIDAGDPGPMYNDPDGSRNDIGAVPFHQGPVVIPTNEWIGLYCANIYERCPIPGVILAIDPDGVVCGRGLIRGDCSYEFMPIYRDDPYTDVDEGAEPGDLIRFRIGGQPAESDPPVYWTENGDVFEVCYFSVQRCIDIPLHTGWNLISWNVDYEAPVEEAIAGIADCVDVIHGYDDGALVWDPELDQFGTLETLDKRHGYWFRMNCPATLTVCGQNPCDSLGIWVDPGWNLVGYWPNEPLDVEYGFGSMIEWLEQAMGFDNGALIWRKGMGSVNTLNELRPGFGYWVLSSNHTRIWYPGCGPEVDTVIIDSMPYPPIISESPTALSGPYVEPSRHWVSIYGDHLTLDGRSLTVGDLIEFRTADAERCGAAVYDGRILKFSPVYGHDESGEVSKRYPVAGDAICIYINGVRVYPDLKWSSEGERIRLSALSTDPRGIPESFTLRQNYPNPFNPETHIGFELPAAGHVQLEVFNVIGQRVRTIVNADYPAGRFEATWNGTADNGARVASGVYFYKLRAGDLERTKKMLLLK